MISRAVWISIAAACGGNARPARDRVLDQLPANVTTILAAGGRALSHARFRPLVDAVRSEVPAGLDCVVDAALASEHVAAGIGPHGELTIAVTTRTRVPCAALGRVDDDLWIATLGSGAPAAGASVLTADDHARARPFLRDAPVAIFVVRDGVRVLATAQPEPLAAWAAFDARDVASATALHGELRGALDKAAASEAIAPFVKAIALERTGSQVVARLGTPPADLAVPLRAALDRAHAPRTERAFPCPRTLTPPVVRCEEQAGEHDRVHVYSLASAAEEIVNAGTSAVVVNSRLEGVRLHDDLARYGLATGDVVVAVDGKRLTRVEQLAPALQAARQRVSLLVSRAQRFGTIELVEQ